MSVAVDNPRPAEAFPVGEYLSDELRERGWAVVDFAEILGRPVQAVSEILNGHREITPTTASEIAAATGTSAEPWLRLQDTYRLWKLSQSQLDEIKAPISRGGVLACAESLGVHPAMVVGRLHHEGLLPWSHLNGLVPGVRSQLEAWLEVKPA